MVNLYCQNCKFYNEMDYDPHCHNFMCWSCERLIIGNGGYEIFEFDDAGDLELYVTKDMFIYLLQKGFMKTLMEIYKNRIWISKEE